MLPLCPCTRCRPSGSAARMCAPPFKRVGRCAGACEWLGLPKKRSVAASLSLYCGSAICSLSRIVSSRYRVAHGPGSGTVSSGHTRTAPDPIPGHVAPCCGSRLDCSQYRPRGIRSGHFNVCTGQPGLSVPGAFGLARHRAQHKPSISQEPMSHLSLTCAAARARSNPSCQLSSPNAIYCSRFVFTICAVVQFY